MKGCNANPDIECRADAYGVALLRLQHLPTSAMPAMLRIVCDCNKLPATCHLAMQHRIDILEAHSELQARGQVHELITR
jgi:hypothetical protein